MTLYPHDIEERLNFDQIRKLLKQFCQSENGKNIATKIKPTDNPALLEKWRQQTHEMVKLKTDDKEKCLFRFPSIESLLLKVKMPGSFLSPEDFHMLKTGINAIITWTQFFNDRSAEYSQLFRLTNKASVDPSLLHKIEVVIDEKGGIRDDASFALAEIRTNILKTERAARSAVQKALEKAKQKLYTDENSSLTVRDGRLVIPVKAEYKKHISGFVHDESASGQTVFMEPEEVLTFNNEVRELKYAEQRECIRILISLADHVRLNMEDLKRGSHVLKKLDLIHAKYQLANHLEGIIPIFKNQHPFQWVNAIHPLLFLSHKTSNKKVVPLTIQLGDAHRILIISGPNAGGKSVVLKTVGLLQYMFQCGLPVPVGEESEFGVFSHLFLDIGDTQSIEDDLSTYSSHLTAIKYFLKRSNKHTLFLIDEFGKGTEPQFGGAMAEAILLQLNNVKSYGIVTTHYHNLKKLGEEMEGLINGAMKYDIRALEPLFELEIGHPGNSFAFEIASKIGLPHTLIEQAKDKVENAHIEYDQLLKQLKQQKTHYEKLSKKAASDKKALEKIRKDYEDLRKMLELQRKRMVKEARQEARQIILDANRDVERVIREIRERHAEKEHTQKLRKTLAEKEKSLHTDDSFKCITVKSGDTVTMEGQDTVGTVQKVKGNQVEVLFGGIKSIVSANRLASTKRPPHTHQNTVKKLGIDLTNKMARFNHKLSIRGMRAGEAMSLVEAFIDEALLLDMDKVYIMHGKGHGILRKMVRNYVKNHPSVAKVEDEHANRGGAGISVITLQ